VRGKAPLRAAPLPLGWLAETSGIGPFSDAEPATEETFRTAGADIRSNARVESKRHLREQLKCQAVSILSCSRRRTD
jgi:hypothetical protein